MAGIKGTRTEKNLLIAFSGESQARSRYTYYASVAKKEGFEQISAIFQETADNENQHAKHFYKFLEGGEVEVTASFPAGVIGSTAENLREAASGENYEHSVMYPEFIKTAEEEGFKDISFQFKKVAEVEEHHKKRFLHLLKNIEEDKVFKKDTPVLWKCRKCGYIHESNEAAKICPVCGHPQAYFEVLTDNL